jgi:alpha-1,2-mannosyltransferase
VGDGRLSQSRAWSRPRLLCGLAGLSFVVSAVYAIALSQHWQVDFEVYRTGGAHVLGNGLYHARVPARGGTLLFTYTPLAAMVFWPFSLVPPRTGQLLWDLTNVAALTTLIAVSVASARGRRPQGADYRLALIAVTPIVLLLWPVRDGFELGQVNVVLVLMVVTDLTTTLTWRRRRLPRGVLVGIAAAIKLTPLIFIPYLVVTRQWRAARNTAVTFLAATGVTMAVAPSASWSYFTRYVFELRRIGPFLATNNQTLRAALERTGLPIPRLAVDLILFTVLCGGMALAAKTYRSSPLLGLLVCAATGLLLSPISWQHHFVWCVPALAWIAFGVDRPRLHWLYLVGVALIFVTVPPAQSAHLSAVGFLRQNSYVVATIAFLVLIATMLRTRQMTHRRDARNRQQRVAAPGGTERACGTSLEPLDAREVRATR